jgi:hypothetical protein
MPKCQICKQNKAIVECPECGHQICPDCYTENKCCQSSFAEDGRRVDDIVIFPPTSASDEHLPESVSRGIVVLRIVKFVFGAVLLFCGIRGLTLLPNVINIFWQNAPTVAGKLRIITALAVFVIPTIVGGTLLIYSALHKSKDTVHPPASEAEI